MSDETQQFIQWRDGQYAAASTGIEPPDKPEPDHIEYSVKRICRLCFCEKVIPTGQHVCAECDNELESER